MENSFPINQIACSICNVQLYLLVGRKYAGYPLNGWVDAVKQRICVFRDSVNSGINNVDLINVYLVLDGFAYS